MSNAQPIRPRQMGKTSTSFAIVASQYNLEFVNGLVRHAHDELTTLEPGCSAKVYWVPGAFEIPVVARALAEQKKHEAILALGLILQGQTAHATLIAQAVSESLQRIALDALIPVIHGVLLVENAEQARARCLEPEINRGTEAARAAVSTARTMAEIKKF